MKVGFISLGCNKNLVDTEMMIGLFKDNKFEIENNPSKAEIIIINTCGFIESSKEEAINTILEMAKYKEEGKCKLLIATGCLVERYKEELEKLLPEVDMFIKYGEYAVEQGKSKETFKKVFEIIFEKFNKKKEHDYNYELSFTNRVFSTGKNYAYVRIAEGCNNRCTFCAIPYIRGKFVSRKMEDIIEEVEGIVKSGRKEIVLVAQDTSKYGIDIYGKKKLSELLEKIAKIKGVEWIRFLYTYPEDISDELIKVVNKYDNICKYFDIPIQHISNNILKKMNRRTTKEDIIKVISKLRKNIDGVIIRTTLMVGFPGEEEKDFNELLEFVERAKFDKLGAFIYSKEDGTPASRIKTHVNGNTKKKRLKMLMELQNKISKENNEKLIKKKLKCLIEDISIDNKYYIGRTYMDTPEIDGLSYIKIDGNPNKDLIGKFKKVEIVDAKEYDIFCKIDK